ncbi:MAG: hypothetical protein KKA61_04680 [Nanoarchaeota archaeon]|nr:hypothetical protein [Nanoarchaeota archaeon]
MAAADLTDEELLNRFEKEISVVRTRADELVKLVKQRGELSFEDAAKQLNVSSSTIEAWANFLEEEKIISIKYNFTTPFLTVFQEKIKKEQKKEKTAEKTADEKEAEKLKSIKKQGLSDIQMMLAEAYSYLKKKDFEKAKEIYAKIKAKYDGLPTEFLEKKNELNTNLIRLSKDLGLNLSKASRNEMEKKSNHIQKLLNILNQKIKKREILDAIKIYGQIKSAYDDLPDGFLEQKLILQNKIIDLYEVLITIREEQDMGDISVKRSEIINLLEEMNQAINEKNTPLAMKLYERIRALYNSLPAGFLQEKAELQSRILRLYEKLLSYYKKITVEDMENKAVKIEELSKVMNNHLMKGDIVSARKTYTQIKDIFYTLPEGFLKQKTELQRVLLNLYERLASQLDKDSFEDFNTKYEKINKMLEDAFNYVRAKRFDLADELYKQIMQIYNSMPSGFLQKKTALRTRILAFYKDISGHEALGKHLIEVPELKEPLEDKKLMEVPLPQTKQFKPEKPFLQSSKKIIPKLQITKPATVSKLEMPKTVRPKSFPPSFPPMPLKFIGKKKLSPDARLNIPLPKAVEKPVKELKPEWLKNMFKKYKGPELTPPTPPDLTLVKRTKK